MILLANQIPKITNIKQISFASNPVKAKGLEGVDTCALSKPSAEILNERLLVEHEVNSDIQDITLLTQFLEVLAEFKEENYSENIFEKLTLKQGKVPKGKIYKYDKDNRILTFSEDFDYKNLAQYTQKQYNRGKIGSQDPKYKLYEALAEDILWWDIEKGKTPKMRSPRFEPFNPKDEIRSYKICDSTNSYDYSKHFIATGMSNVKLPYTNWRLFWDYNNNLPINLSNWKSLEPREIKTNFKTTTEAQMFFYSHGIFGAEIVEDENKTPQLKIKLFIDFPNLEIANILADAVTNVTNATGSKHTFFGLRMLITPFAANNTNPILNGNPNSMATMTCYNLADSPDEYKYLLKINSNMLENFKARVSNCYETCYHPTTSLQGIFEHELVHFLEMKKSEDKLSLYATEIDKSNKRDKMAICKVSEYALKDRAEFIAEYATGRLDGVHYPRCTDRLFEKYYLGPKINFPE